jgi:hypothetical protein
MIRIRTKVTIGCVVSRGFPGPGSTTVHFLGYLVNSPVKIIISIQAQIRQSARLFLQSSELGPLSRKRVYPPGTKRVETHSPAGEGVGGPNSDEGTDSVALGKYSAV